MNKLLVFVAICSSSFSFSQNWTPSELEIINQFNLSMDDHRGLFFSVDSSESVVYSTLEDALQNFFTPTIMNDITKVYVEEFPEGVNLSNTTIGIKEAIRYYNELQIK